ncbi:MAG: VIT domain-containing protein [Spirochaetia bacterium]
MRNTGRIIVPAALMLALLSAAVGGADGLIVVSNPPAAAPGHFGFAPLQVLYHRVTVTVNGLVAVTDVDQEFYNASSQRLEGTYVFPIPPGAHIDRFSMEVGGRMVDGELLPADKARSLYEEIVRKERDPALLEYAGRGAFTLRIFPIEPQSGKKIRIRYTQLLTSDSGMSEYVYTLGTEKFSSTPVAEVSVKMTIDGEQPLKTVYSPSHDVEVRRQGDRRAVVGWEARNAWPDTDFKVIFSRTPNPLGIDFMASRQPGQDGYFVLMASPGMTAEKGAIAAKDVCFVLDTSGSMAGAKLTQAKKALRFCLASLSPQDRFEVVRFSTEAEPLFNGLVPADGDHTAKAADFVDGLTAMGGTAIADALDAALSLRGAGDRPFMVIFLTDGIPTVGETSEEALVARVTHAGHATRIFSFGIGNDVNAHLLDRIASDTRGVSQYVLPGEDIEMKVSSFYAKINEPVFSDLALSFTNPGIRVTQVLPSALPDLFNGDVVVVFGRYSGSGSSAVRISGQFNGKRRDFAADLSFPAEQAGNDYIPRLWAARRVGWLLDEIRMHGESAELRDEIIRLAREFGIVTPYTASLILEDEERRSVPASLRSFQELEDDMSARDKARGRLDSVRKEAASESSRAGAPAVQNSIAMKDLKSSWNEGQAAQASGLEKAALAPPSAGYKAAQQNNYAQQVRVVNGRAFYQNGNVWTDSTAQLKRSLKQKRVVFGSREYFELLGRTPALASWLALGSDLDVVVDDTLYSIRN